MEKTVTAKDKLLEILGDFALDDLSERGLLEVLAVKLKRQEEVITELCRENDRERQRLHDETESLMREHKELRRNPSMIFGGPFFFIGDKGEKYFVQINRGRVEAFEQKKKGVQYTLQQITREQYEVMS